MIILNNVRVRDDCIVMWKGRFQISIIVVVDARPEHRAEDSPMWPKPLTSGVNN